MLGRICKELDILLSEKEIGKIGFFKLDYTIFFHPQLDMECGIKLKSLLMTRRKLERLTMTRKRPRRPLMSKDVVQNEEDIMD